MGARGALLALGAAALAAALGFAAYRYLSTWRPPGAPDPSLLPVPVRPAASPLVGQPVAAFELPDLRQRPMRLPPTGQPVLINYWASWCEPCVREMPLLDQYHRTRSGGRAGVVGVALDTPAGAADFLARRPVSFPILLEEPGEDDSSVRLGNFQGVLPYTVLIDSQGRLQAVHIGPFEDLRELQAWASAAR